MGVEDDRGVYTADLINSGNNVERVVEKKQSFKARGDKTYVIRRQETKSGYDTLNWQAKLTYIFMALANDLLGATKSNVRLDCVTKLKLLAFRALLQVQPGEQLVKYTDDRDYWLL